MQVAGGVSAVVTSRSTESTLAIPMVDSGLLPTDTLQGDWLYSGLYRALTARWAPTTTPRGWLGGGWSRAGSRRPTSRIRTTSPR